MLGPLKELLQRMMEARAERIVRLVGPHLPPGGRILDIGSGTGHNAVAIGRRGDARCMEVDVVDFHTVGDGPFLFDGERLPVEDGQFDASLLIHVLSHAKNPAELLREAGRAASQAVIVVHTVYHGPWGRAFLWLRSWLQGSGAFRTCRALRLIPWAPDPLAIRQRFSRAELESVVEASGLLVVRREFEAGPAFLTSRALLILRRPGVIPGPASEM